MRQRFDDANPTDVTKESNMSKIAVVGATGRVGRHVVEILGSGGHDVVRISRSTGIDVITREGLEEALAGVECIVDAATGPSPDQTAATEFFTTAARNLQELGHAAGVSRIVVVSIIGIDRFSTGYQAAKLAHERVHLAGPVPVRILRAAQFHEFVEELMAWGRQGDMIYVPNMRTQIVAARTVAEALAELATDEEPVPPAGDEPIWEIAGPREERLVDLARVLAARRGDPARIEAAPDPAGPDAGLYEAGALLPGSDATLAGPTFDEWLDTRVTA
jgi:uncharacterized protein YbjT (DUF2867 family)